jgi:hypothetical protein
LDVPFYISTLTVAQRDTQVRAAVAADAF